MVNNSVLKFISLIGLGFLLIYPVSKVKAQETDSLFSKNTKRVLFLGNSITYAGSYVNIFETYCITKFSTHRLEVINAALPSETVSGLSEFNHADGKFPRPCLFTRLPSVLEKTKADVAFACYGMNDGIYLPFDEDRFAVYKVGMIKLHNALKSAGIKRIIFITPPIHDDKLAGINGYNKVLDRYANWLLKQEAERNWEVIDVHFPMKTYLINKRKSDPTFKLANDGVHPDELGHWLIAREIFRHFGAIGVADKPTLNDFFGSSVFFPELYKLVSQRQEQMKNAWLTFTKHNRPGIATGLPMDKAKELYDQIENEIQKVLQ